MADQSDPFWDKWMELVHRLQDAPFESLSNHEQHFYALNHFKGSLLRGGFHLYFSNTSPTEIETVERALTESGASTFVDILLRAKAVMFPAGVPTDPSKYGDTVPGWSDEEIENDITPQWSLDLDPVEQEADAQRKDGT